MQRLAASISLALLSVGVGACGGSSVVTTEFRDHLSNEVASCLRRAGIVTETRTIVGGSTMIGGGTANGDLIFIVDLPRPGLSGHAANLVRRSLHGAGLGAIMTASTVNHGSRLVMIFGHKGADGGVPALGSELLAKHCAVES
jgi:hypothetical protein